MLRRTSFLDNALYSANAPIFITFILPNLIDEVQKKEAQSGNTLTLKNGGNFACVFARSCLWPTSTTFAHLYYYWVLLKRIILCFFGLSDAIHIFRGQSPYIDGFAPYILVINHFDSFNAG